MRTDPSAFVFDLLEPERPMVNRLSWTSPKGQPLIRQT
jgi:hypothetical protein